MEEKILTEITDFCEECSSHESCPEEDCVLYRIEQIIIKNDKENASKTDKKLDKYS